MSLLGRTTVSEPSESQNDRDAGTHEWSVEQAARKKLAASGYGPLKSVLCEFDFQTGVLTLRGSVATYYLKQLAQTHVAGMKDVKEINNLIEVTQATD